MIDEELKVHIDAIEGWINKHLTKNEVEGGLSRDERKQLQAIENSIKQLSKNGIEIPDDLRRLKLKLSARDIVPRELSEAQIAAISELIDELRKITDRARSIQKRTKQPGGTSSGKRHYNVSLKDLVEGGYLTVDDHIEFSYKNGEVRAEGKVTASGSVSIQTDTDWDDFASLSTAAKDIAGRSLNGWMYWWKVNPNGSPVLLDKIRQQFLDERNEE